jgi:hypothetical protein
VIDWFIIPNEGSPLQKEMELAMTLVSEHARRLFERGWGNGYVAVPPGHPWYEKDYNSIDCDAPGGLTFSSYAGDMRGVSDRLHQHWVVGFDTGHAWNNSDHDKQYVINETVNLYAQAYVMQLNAKAIHTI